MKTPPEPTILPRSVMVSLSVPIPPFDYNDLGKDLAAAIDHFVEVGDPGTFQGCADDQGPRFRGEII
jgi:hypothetical protein